FLRWKQTAKPARTTATEYLVRWRRNYEHPPGYLCCSLLALRQDSFITCLIEVFIECRTRKCVRQRLVLFVIRAEIPKKIDARVCRHSYCRACLCFFTARAEWNFGCHTTASAQGDLHAQACVPGGMGETGAHRQRCCPGHD